ncbi:MAG: tRNA (N6-isopentenyl adenosine(37)-C2)-methylthiotransferase MiaB [Phycisphaerae bacterium]|nr:tRNA (N6-isopentenyl adenosine(37)-C2)-methylthiotransferase MiaB [Phycisphaerae bacterium]
MNIYLETFGCQMNRLDSELIAELLRVGGHTMTDSAAADVVLYNTCSVRDHAEQKVYSRIGRDAKAKAAGRKLIVGVVGCMAQRAKADLRRRCPCVDLICSPGQLHRLVGLIEAAAAGKAAKLHIASDPGRAEPPDQEAQRLLEEVDRTRNPLAAPSASQAFVRVMRGCNKFCSYCIVPFVRGAEHSRPPQPIYEEVKKLVEAGRSEITLIGQTVNSYCYRQGDSAVRFGDLLEFLSPIADLRRLRFVTSHPVDFDRPILEAMRDLPNVCPYIHVPPQSGSDAMLAAMNRKYTRGEYDTLIDAAREIVPDVVFAGDFIVGFPGETEEDHLASAELIRRTSYKNSFVFKYSPRPGTQAAKKLADDVPEAVKKHRNNELLAVQREVGLAHHRSYVGRSVEVLVTGPSRRCDKQPAPATADSMQLMGRSRGDHIVIFDGPRSLTDQYITIKITDANDLTLFGEMEELQ